MLQVVTRVTGRGATARVFAAACLLAVASFAPACGPSVAQVQRAKNANYSCTTDELQVTLATELKLQLGSMATYGSTWIVGPDIRSMRWTGDDTFSQSAAPAGSMNILAATSALFLLPKRTSGPPPRDNAVFRSGGGGSSGGSKRHAQDTLVVFGRLVNRGGAYAFELHGRVIRPSRGGGPGTMERSSTASAARDRVQVALFDKLGHCRLEPVATPRD